MEIKKGDGEKIEVKRKKGMLAQKVLMKGVNHDPGHVPDRVVGRGKSRSPKGET